MLSRIRLAMQTRAFGKLSGAVEGDETFIGRKVGNIHESKRKRLGKIGGPSHMETVVGLLERKRGARHSSVRRAHVAAPSRKHLEPAIRNNLEQGSNLYTDAAGVYRELGKFQ